MTGEQTQATGAGKAGSFYIEGQIQREQAECESGELQLAAYAFDKAGVLLGSGAVDGKGNYSVPVRLTQPVGVELMVGPVGDAQQIRHSSAYRKTFTAKEWVGEGEQFRLRHDALLPLAVWRPWWPQRICISGHVRKVNQHEDGITSLCPVPFVKVEIFDVDRENCFWPPLRKWWEYLLDKPVIRIPDLLKEPRIPIKPFPDPDPIADLLDTNIAARLETLTLTSKLAPWIIFPHCFYSRVEVCETTTDCNGYFNCCFNWWPFHFRRGRLRFDARPDIIIKVTQVINGVPTVIYMDPYTSTRWNVSHAHIDLFLDNEEVRCGDGCTPQPEGAATFFTLVGLDEVYKIDQVSGKFGNLAFGGSLDQWAYGGSLLLSGVFGDALSDGISKRYYRLSYKSGLANADPNDNTGFVPIDYPLTDTRVNKVTFDSEVVTIGPQPPVNGVPGLYEIRNTADYYWYNRDKLGWLTTDVDGLGLADGMYTVRLEVFDALGVKLTSAAVDYRDGTDPPPGALPPMTNRCDLVILVDNQHPVLGLTVPGASGACGVVPFSAVPGLAINISIDQANARLHSWNLSFVKGITGGSGFLGGNTNDSGILPLPVVASIPAAPMTAGLTGTCAFALTLGAWPLVRNGFGSIHHATKTIAIAVEKCPDSGKLP